jgi:hypothetical protein
LRWVRAFPRDLQTLDGEHRQLLDRVEAAILALQQPRRKGATGAMRASSPDDLVRYCVRGSLLTC